MADTSGMADIRGIDINKMAIAYQDEALVFKSVVAQTETSAREVRYYKKTSGFLTPTSPSVIKNVAYGARPDVLEQSWTRHSAYVKKYFVESPTIPMEDIMDSDIDILTGNLRDLTLAISYQVDSDIWDVISESQSASTINSNATAAAWDTASYTGVNVVEDLMEAMQNIRENSGFDPITRGAVLFLNSKGHRSLMNWIIDGKGSSIPQVASAKFESGVVMNILGLRVMISENVTDDFALVIIPQIAATWKNFVGLTTASIKEEGIGTKIRVWQEGVCVLERPKCINLITNIDA